MGEAKRRKQCDPSYGKVHRIKPPRNPNDGKVQQIEPPPIKDGFSADFGWLVYQHLGETPLRLYLKEFVRITPGVSLVRGKKDCYEIIGRLISGEMSPANLALLASCGEKGAIVTFEIDGSRQFAEDCLKKLTTSPGAIVCADFSRRFRTPQTQEDVIPLIVLSEEDEKDAPSACESELIAPSRNRVPGAPNTQKTDSQLSREVLWLQ